jgi:hypothetical protein
MLVVVFFHLRLLFLFSVLFQLQILSNSSRAFPNAMLCCTKHWIVCLYCTRQIIAVLRSVAAKIAAK